MSRSWLAASPLADLLRYYHYHGVRLVRQRQRQRQRLEASSVQGVQLGRFFLQDGTARRKRRCRSLEGAGGRGEVGALDACGC